MSGLETGGVFGTNLYWLVVVVTAYSTGLLITEGINSLLSVSSSGVNTDGFTGDSSFFS